MFFPQNQSLYELSGMGSGFRREKEKKRKYREEKTGVGKRRKKRGEERREGEESGGKERGAGEWDGREKEKRKGRNSGTAILPDGQSLAFINPHHSSGLY